MIEKKTNSSKREFHPTRDISYHYSRTMVKFEFINDFFV